MSEPSLPACFGRQTRITTRLPALIPSLFALGARGCPAMPAAQLRSHASMPRDVAAIRRPADSPSIAVGALTIVTTLVGWSSVPLFITHFAGRLDVWTQNGWRYALAALLWAPVPIVAHARGRLPRGLWRASLWPAVFNGLGQTAFTWSYYKTDAASATFGLRAQIVFVAIGAYLLFPAERALLRRPAAWFGIALVLAGVSGTIFLAPAANHSAPTHALGVLLAVIGGVLFASYGLSVRRNMAGMHPVVAFAAISQLTALICVALMLIFGHSLSTARWDGGLSVTSLNPNQFGLLFLSAVIGIALGHVFYYIAIARIGVAAASAVLQLQPFLVALGAYLVHSAAVSPAQITAGCIAVAGALVILAVQWKLSRAARSSSVAQVPTVAAPK